MSALPPSSTSFIPPSQHQQQAENHPQLHQQPRLPGPLIDYQLPIYPVNPSTKPPKVHSCVLCQQRKVKCNRQSPCSNCQKARVECIPSVSTRPRRRKKRFPEAELLARLKKYEDMLRDLGVKLEGEEGGEQANACPLGGEEKAEEEDGDGIKLEKAKARKTSVNGVWAAMSDEFRDIEEALAGSSSDETETPIIHTYDSLYTSDGTELLGFPSHSDVNLASLQPNPVQIFQLWQTFLENIHPLLKLFHAPTIQQQIFQIAASVGSGGIGKEMEALMFGIYAFAVVTMDEFQCESVFGSGAPGGGRKELLAKFHYGCRIALVRADFMRSADLTVLQAFLLYLYSVRQILDPRSLFLLTGLSIRIGQRLNLHRSVPLPPFQTEMRRRLWWQLLLLDTRIAEMSGAGTSSLTTNWSTSLPSNVNDADLNLAMTTSPVEHKTVTEMVFVLLRCELVEFVRQQRILPQQTQKTREKAISDFESHLELKYLQQCDPNIPLHYISILTARTQLAKMRLHLYIGSSTSGEREKAFIAALTMLENLSACFSNPTISTQWKWYIVMNIPLDGYIYILSSLRERTSGELADRAWTVLESLNRTRDLTKRKDAPPGSPPGERNEDVMQHRLNSLAVKAWEAKDRAALAKGEVLNVPRWIARAREGVRGRKSRQGTGVSGSSDGSPAGLTPGPFNMVDNRGIQAGVVEFGMGVPGGMVQGQGQSFGMEEYPGQMVNGGMGDVAMGMGLDWGDYWGDVTDFY